MADGPPRKEYTMLGLRSIHVGLTRKADQKYFDTARNIDLMQIMRTEPLDDSRPGNGEPPA